ncbi:hypothetical protein C0995_010459 [Termitomyces sp. Mi166|nr:hypothetical protein C0995_010459 [Termitomyces sp. Mi166\
MAKPIFADRPGCSASSTRSSYTSASRRKRKSSPPTPSSAVLALLATISDSLPSAEASPAPLSFLCPSFIPQPTPTLNARTRTITPPPVLKRSLNPRSPLRSVPDKFEKGDNGRWRRVDTYTLYGSTVCLSCEEDAVTTSTAVSDDQIQNSATSSVPISTAETSTSTYSISLPPGWKTQEASSAGRTTLILALSLVLASVICFFIISCIFWRKKKRRGREHADVEKKARKRRRQPAGDDDGISMLTEREVKVKQKIWAKATARWKANAKYTARQRRGKRFGMTTRVNSPRSSCASLDRVEETQSTVAQPPMTTSLATLSPRSSLESLYTATETTRLGETGHILSSPVEETRTGDPPEVSSSCLSSPPAYHGDNLAQTSGRDKGLPISEAGSTLPGSNTRSSSYDLHSQNNAPYPIHAAHVATDDKRLLARMAEFTSAPPPDPAGSSDASATYHASVPVWQDEELEDFGEGVYHHESAYRDLSPSGFPSSPSSSASFFPSPPSKGKMVAPAFYDYPYTFDDMLIEPESGPSAPPFEEESSNPSDMTGLAPSAPPLTESEAYYADTYPSAPSHDWPDASGSQSFAVDGQTTSTIPSHDAYSGSRSPGDNSDPLVQGPIASDGTPPCYYP